MAKTMTTKELDAQIDRLVASRCMWDGQRDAVECASCETESERKAFRTVLESRYQAAKAKKTNGFKPTEMGETDSEEPITQED